MGMPAKPRHTIRIGARSFSKSVAMMAVFVIFASLLVSGGCETFRPTPVVSQVRVVYPVVGDTGTVTVLKDLTFNDSVRRTYTIIVPRGIYRIEAQDDDYRYYALTGLLKRCVYDGKQRVESNVFCGGLMVAKRSDVAFPAGVYKSDGSMNRTMLWRFDEAFLALKGEAWTESEGK